MNDNEEELPFQSNVKKKKVDSEINSRERFEDINLDKEVIDLIIVGIELKNLIRRRRKYLLWGFEKTVNSACLIDWINEFESSGIFTTSISFNLFDKSHNIHLLTLWNLV